MRASGTKQLCYLLLGTWGCRWFYSWRYGRGTLVFRFFFLIIDSWLSSSHFYLLFFFKWNTRTSVSNPFKICAKFCFFMHFMPRVYITFMKFSIDLWLKIFLCKWKQQQKDTEIILIYGSFGKRSCICKCLLINYSMR